jgi:hypothetical protein
MRPALLAALCAIFRWYRPRSRAPSSFCGAEFMYTRTSRGAGSVPSHDRPLVGFGVLDGVSELDRPTVERRRSASAPRR